MTRKYANTFVPSLAAGEAAKIHLLIIDPQVDFMDQPASALPVTGASADMLHVADLIERMGARIAGIHVTLDSHHPIDIAHPVWFKDEQGNHPAPFVTLITSEMLEKGEMITTHAGARQRTIDYEKALEASGRYPHVIWPPHCLIGSIGATVFAPLFETLRKYEESFFRMVDYVTKGSNVFTEHYSAVMAEVQDPSDPGTMLNARLITTLQQADVVAIAGEALDYCVANTLRDIMNNFGEDNIKKMVILTDCTSPVGLPAGLDDAFMAEFISRGGKTCESTEFFA